MTDKERIVEILKKHTKKHGIMASFVILEEYAAELVNNGVIVPPCKVGDIIWVVFSPKYPANPNDKGKWFMVQDGVQRIIFGKKGLSIETWNMGTIPAKELNKKIFLTKEEAEEKLKGLQE